MSVNTIVIAEGTTQVLKFQLLQSGAAINLNGLTVTLTLTDHMGNAINTTNAAAIVDAVNGVVSYTPPTSVIFVAANGPYYARWVLTDSQGGVSYAPSDARDVWNIVVA